MILFQFQSGAIKSKYRKWSCKFTGSSFNSKVVRLKEGWQIFNGTDLNSFNSKVVRLKVVKLFITQQMWYRSFNSKVVRLKEKLLLSLFTVDCRFNSKVVRLKDQKVKILISYRVRFNSKVVRLKVYSNLRFYTS